VPDPGWVVCPECGGAARQEVGGVRCVIGGHLLTFLRQWAIDQAFMHPARGGEIPLRLLERLEEGVDKRRVSPE
jgi:hypothetical protein